MGVWRVLCAGRILSHFTAQGAFSAISQLETAPNLESIILHFPGGRWLTRGGAVGGRAGQRCSKPDYIVQTSTGKYLFIYLNSEESNSTLLSRIFRNNVSNNLRGQGCSSLLLFLAFFLPYAHISAQVYFKKRLLGGRE